jgi:phage terminase Nu1 subunit (DNA packaging protein)
MILNKKQIAEAFGVTTQAVDKWEKDGFPVHERNTTRKGNQYILKDCIEWRIEQKIGKGDYNAQRTRLTKAQAAKHEIELELIKGEIVKKEDILKEFNKVLRELRAQLLALPNRATVLLQGVEEFEDRKEVIEKLLYEVLEKFANNAESDNNGSSKKSTSSAKTKGKRVVGQKKSTQ